MMTTVKKIRIRLRRRKFFSPYKQRTLPQTLEKEPDIVRLNCAVLGKDPPIQYKQITIPDVLAFRLCVICCNSIITNDQTEKECVGCKRPICAKCRKTRCTACSKIVHCVECHVESYVCDIDSCVKCDRPLCDMCMPESEKCMHCFCEEFVSCSYCGRSIHKSETLKNRNGKGRLCMNCWN